MQPPGSCSWAGPGSEPEPDTDPGPFKGGPIEATGLFSDRPLMRVVGDRLVMESESEEQEQEQQGRQAKDGDGAPSGQQQQQGHRAALG